MAPSQQPNGASSAPTQSSLFHLVRIAQWISLPPVSLANPLPATCAQVLSPLLLSYYPPAEGIVLAWQDVELNETAPTPSQQLQKPQPRRNAKKAKKDNEESGVSDSGSDNEEERLYDGKPLLLQTVDEYSAPFLWVTATLLVLRPRKNAWIEGRVASQAATHITLSYLNVFSVSIVAEQLPGDWTWCAASGAAFSMTGGAGASSGEGGYWMDGQGVPVSQTLRVRIRDWDARTGSSGGGKGFVRIEGSLVEEGAAGAAGTAAGRRAEKEKRREKEKGKRKSALKAAPAVQASEDAMEVE